MESVEKSLLGMNMAIQQSLLKNYPVHMAPESYKLDQSPSKKADIWALGVILYNLCTLEKPF